MDFFCLVPSVLLFSELPETRWNCVNPMWRAAVSDKKRLWCFNDRKPQWWAEDPQGQSSNKSQKGSGETEAWGNHSDPAPENQAHPPVWWEYISLYQRLFLQSFGFVVFICYSYTLEFFLTMVTSCRSTSVFQLEVQTSRRLPHWSLLLDGPVLLHEGWSGERQEPGNQSDVRNVEDHLWLQDR